jgi:hypothetical protein
MCNRSEVWVVRWYVGLINLAGTTGGLIYVIKKPGRCGKVHWKERQVPVY